jgi:hypothetical protein
VAQVTPVQVIAAGRITAALNAWLTTWIRGALPAVAYGGVGIATITLDDPADPGTIAFPGTVTVVTPVDSAAGYFATASRPSDTTVQINLWSATAVPADVSFEFLVLQAPTTTS